MEPDELKVMVEKIREIEKAIGDGNKNGPRPEELGMYDTVRRSIHAAIAIKAGDIITEKMLTTKLNYYNDEYRKNNSNTNKYVCKF